MLEYTKYQDYNDRNTAQFNELSCGTMYRDFENAFTKRNIHNVIKIKSIAHLYQNWKVNKYFMVQINYDELMKAV